MGAMSQLAHENKELHWGPACVYHYTRTHTHSSLLYNLGAVVCMCTLRPNCFTILSLRRLDFMLWNLVQFDLHMPP